MGKEGVEPSRLFRSSVFETDLYTISALARLVLGYFGDNGIITYYLVR